MVVDIIVDYYGAPTPLKQLATIVAPDPDLLVIQPYDKTRWRPWKRPFRPLTLD
jgi:ribosome recycling factor